MPVGVGGRPPGSQPPALSIDILTPPDLLVALGGLAVGTDGEYKLGPDPFSLDPTASIRQPWPTAKTMWTVHDDGASRDWSPYGSVWGNFPYGAQLYHWLARLADHGSGLALLYARTDTRGFHAQVWARATAVFFLAGRLHFHEPVTGDTSPHKNCGGPMVLACYGDAAVERARRLEAPGSPYPGHLVTVRRQLGDRVITKRGRK
jgi:hypothetical protein